MANVVRWASLGPPQCANAALGSLISKCHPFRGRYFGRKKCCWSSRRGSRQRGDLDRIGAFDDTRSELVMNGSASANEFSTLALLFPDSPENDGSVGSRQELQLKLQSEYEASNELYDKLAENAIVDGSISDGVQYESNPEEETDSDQAYIEVGKEQSETRIGASAYQQASKLLEAVNKTLDGLEDDLFKHAEELEASAVMEDITFSGDVPNVTEGWEQAWSETSSQSLELEQMQEEIVVRDKLLEMMRQEAVEASQTLKTATQAMITAKGKITYLQEQLDTTTGFLQQEKEATQRALDLFSSSLLALSDAEARIRELEKQVEIGSQIQENLADMDSLKGLLDTKERIIQSMRDENRRNANMLLAAAKTREGLANAEKKVELFTAQVEILEEEVRSRDLLLREVRDEMVRSTDALKLASHIKQELNISKQKEIELTQDLEIERSLVKELRQELAENHRAIHAEQALRQMEKKLESLKLEIDMLRGGVGARDDALRLMRDEVDRSVEVLADAAENREVRSFPSAFNVFFIRSVRKHLL
uniref:Uncharacterized protein n=1 Tax=Physcomitrium patens TaxID=3218 RepID=A0A7I4E5M3_PHYPA